MAPSRITLVAHTHWDREWYQPFEVFRANLVEMLDEALDHMERDPRLTFTLDGHVALVDDYLEIRPMNEPRIEALVREGRLHVGPWYTQADTLLADGESLIRNLAMGIRRADQLGGAMRVGYMPDQFGHAAQLPQLLRQFDIDSAVLWRGVGPDRPPHAFRWTSPDGSEVTALWLQDGYGSGRRLPSDPEGFADAIDRTLERLGSWAGEMPVLFPVGDDHVKLAVWLPEAAEAVRARHPEMEVALGGYHEHLPRLGAVQHPVRGELRSPAFAPVLAGVASARIREKQMGWRGAMLLERYAEPLWALARQAGALGSLAPELIARAWRQLVLNHAHDSIAGCGVDLAHEDVKGRFRWAEQLALQARDQLLGQLRVEQPAGASAHVVAFHPGPAAPSVQAECELPRSLEAPMVAVGADGLAWPVQLLGAADQPPVFEGEFPTSELKQYLGGLDPATPLFGKYLSGISARPEAPGVVRLDVGLGDHPVAHGALAEDQRKIEKLIETTERFKVVLHSGNITRPALVQAGPAPELSLVSIAIKPGSPTANLPRAGKLESDRPGIFAGPLQVIAQDDGTVLIRDERVPLSAVRANDLVDEGDRGDLYHFDSAGGELKPRAARARVVEEGPLRARLVIEQELELPLSLTDDRQGRGKKTRTHHLSTEITVRAGERRVDFVTTFDNEARDHRLRALVHAPMHAERLDVEHGLAVVARPLDTSLLGAGTERAAPTGQHHLFVDVSDGKAGVALMSRGLPEHEAQRERTEEGEATRLALTLVRSVGWLSRGDLKVIDHAAGPMVPTPGAQELGPHRFEYAVVLHRGDWQEGEVMADARRYAAPPLATQARGKLTVPLGQPLVEVGPSQVVLTAVHPAEASRGTIVRVLNASSRAVDAQLKPAFRASEALEVTPLETPVEPARARVQLKDGSVRLSLGPWQLATVLLR